MVVGDQMLAKESEEADSRSSSSYSSSYITWWDLISPCFSCSMGFSLGLSFCIGFSSCLMQMLYWKWKYLAMRQ